MEYWDNHDSSHYNKLICMDHSSSYKVAPSFLVLQAIFIWSIGTTHPAHLVFLVINGTVYRGYNLDVSEEQRQEGEPAYQTYNVETLRRAEGVCILHFTCAAVRFFKWSICSASVIRVRSFHLEAWQKNYHLYRLSK
jgi:hypothetical protein